MTDGAQVQLSTPIKGSAIAKTTLGLDTLYQEYQQYKAASGVQTVRPPFRPRRTMARVTADNRVVIDAVATAEPQALKAQLEGLGAVVTAVAGKIVSARLPLDRIPALSQAPNLLFARPALASTRAGLVTSQGDRAMGSDTARASCSVTGVGSTVGVLSDSYDCLGGAADDVASRDLPAGVNVVQEISDCYYGIDEGRAMAQIVHDVAPGAAIQFHTAFDGEADFAQGIIDLRAAGSNIIVDDVGYFAEPFFQDGVIAQAVDTVVAAGAAYFSAAGNAARQSYDDAFRPSTSYSFDDFAPGSPVEPGFPPQYFRGGVAHDFDPGTGVDNFQKITCHENDALIITLQWDNPYPSLGGPPPTTDIDIYLLDDPPKTVIASSADSQPPGDPIEFFGGICDSTFTVNLMVVIYSGAPPTRIKYVNYGYGASIDEYDTQSPALVGHPNAAGAIATGASAYFLTPAFGMTSPVLNFYSSAGGVPILFRPNGTPIPGGELRAKPEISAPDGGDNTFFGRRDPEVNGWPNFFGTSAAAPHAAATAALMLEKNSRLTPAEIKTAMQATAVDMTQRVTQSFSGPLVPIGVGFDSDSGAGLISAHAVCQMSCYVDADEDIDRNDLALISRARGRTPTFNDARDANGDGRINPADVQACIPQCTRPNCAAQ